MEVRRRVSQLHPIQYEIIRALYLRKHPLTRLQVAKLLKQKGYGRFRRASTVRKIEERALEALRLTLGLLMAEEVEPLTLWEEMVLMLTLVSAAEALSSLRS
jgi:hypothetical protein